MTLYKTISVVWDTETGDNLYNNKYPVPCYFSNGVVLSGNVFKYQLLSYHSDQYS